jgi:hypothetical protein
MDISYSHFQWHQRVRSTTWAVIDATTLVLMKKFDREGMSCNLREERVSSKKKFDNWKEDVI